MNLKKRISYIALTALMIGGPSLSAFGAAGDNEITYDDNGFYHDKNGTIHYQPMDQLEDHTYQISNAGQLYYFAEQVNNKNIEDDAKINLEEDITVPAGMDWTPIGVGLLDEEGRGIHFHRTFKGVFNGNNHKISGLCFKKNDDIYRFIGLFGIVEEGQVKNVSVINSHFESKGAVGAICGLAVGGYDNENNKEKWAKIKNCSGENNIVVQLDKEDWDHPYNELVGVVDNAIVE